MHCFLFFLCVVVALNEVCLGYPHTGNTTSPKCLQMTQKKEQQVKEIVKKITHFINKLGEQYKGLDLTVLHIDVDEQRRGQQRNDKTMFKVTVNNCIRKDGLQPEEYDYDNEDDEKQPIIINQYTINNENESISYNNKYETEEINENTDITNNYYGNEYRQQNNNNQQSNTNQQNKENNEQSHTAQKSYNQTTDEQRKEREQKDQVTKSQQNNQQQYTDVNDDQQTKEQQKNQAKETYETADQEHKNKENTNKQIVKQENTKEKTAKQIKTNEEESSIVTVFQWNIDDNGEELLDLLEKNGIKNSPFVVYEQKKEFLKPAKVVKKPIKSKKIRTDVDGKTDGGKNGANKVVLPTIHYMYLPVSGEEVLDTMKEGDNPVLVFIQEEPEVKRLVVFRNNRPRRV